MTVGLNPEHEAQRLAALRALRILDTPIEERFERIVRVVAAHFAVPIAAINLVAAERVCSKAIYGSERFDIPREISFCSHVVLTDELVLVADTTRDVRFSQNPLVTAAPRFRFYAGAPLRDSEGYVLGTLCLLDMRPRTLSASKVKHLLDFANWAERELTTEQLSTALLRQQAIADALLLSERRYATVLATLAEGIVVQDSEGQIITCNASAERILGLTADEMLGRRSVDPRWRAIHEDGSPFPGEEHPAMVVLRTGQPCENVVMGVHKPDGRLCWIRINARPLLRPGVTAPYGVVSSFVDITQHQLYAQQLKTYQRQLEQQNDVLTVLATTDSLTGLLNRRTLIERLADALERAQQSRRPLSLVLLDVDFFKAYNDAFGHPAGDAVLAQVAQVLQRNIRSCDTVARYGGEEFALILPDADIAEAHRIAERCRTAIAEASFPHRSITASFGVAAYTGDPLTTDLLIASADIALYAAKRQGRNRVVSAPAVPGPADPLTPTTAPVGLEGRCPAAPARG